MHKWGSLLTVRSDPFMLSMMLKKLSSAPVFRVGSIEGMLNNRKIKLFVKYMDRDISCLSVSTTEKLKH